jgi:hypothetical protein
MVPEFSAGMIFLSIGSAPELAQDGEPLLEVGNEILGLLEADMEAAERAGELAGPRGARDEAGGR